MNNDPLNIRDTVPAYDMPDQLPWLVRFEYGFYEVWEVIGGLLLLAFVACVGALVLYAIFYGLSRLPYVTGWLVGRLIMKGK